ncbi:glycosyltransferase [Rossellomorea sp. AcN35-11]|nr:glycosyltransferase [Rossellomorea aquimaris]WJV28848.1 glycosyltransferase [Rossellomorea sp. AcN35-11]
MIPFSNVKVACILDEFSYECFRHECKFIKVYPENWQSTLIREKPDILFVESAWQGNESRWQYKVGNYQNNDLSDLKLLTQWCKSHNIPTVFWNKEDPVHFNFFIKAAKLFDYVYTTDENCVEKYKTYLGHNRVQTLTFAAQPKLHNPIRVNGFKEKNIMFAGSYYGKQHPERNQDVHLLLDVASIYGLDIYDRNYNKNSVFKFPQKYKRYIRGSLEYQQLVNHCKKYKICLNVNSVKNSNTMCSRRLFELLASGVSVVSTNSNAIQSMFSNLISVVANKTDANFIISSILNREDWRKIREVKGIRLIYDHHTYTHRIYNILKSCKIPVENPFFKDILVLGYADTLKKVELLLSSFNKQNYRNKKLIIFIENSLPLDRFNNIHHKDYIEFIKITNTNIKLSDYCKGSTFAALFYPTNYYGPHYLKDLYNGAIYSEASIVGKAGYYQRRSTGNIALLNKDEHFVYNKNILNTGSIIKHEFIETSQLTLTDLLNLKSFRNKIVDQICFSIDPYNFINSEKDINNEYQIIDKVKV